jgi:flagellar biosynthesis/type III secretory pathway protein FliH
VSYYLLQRGGDALLATGRPVLKAGEQPALRDSFQLLARLREADAARETSAAMAERDARERGWQAGFAEGQRAFAEAVAEIAAQAARHRDAREAEIASLAVAALHKMVGMIGDEIMMAGIAQRAVAAVTSRGPILVETSEAMCGGIEAALAGQEAEEVNVRVDPALGDRQCRITAPDGRIIADLDLQLDALEKRWETAHVD